MNSVDSVSKLLTEIFGAYKTWLATRDEAYKRHKDKQLAKALNYAEQYILIDIANKGKKLSEKNKIKVNKLKDKYSKGFFKYNN